MIYRFIAIAGLLALAACSSASTDEIGARITADEVRSPPGVNSFSIMFDTNNPGIPLDVRMVSGKDEEDIALHIEYPNGTKWSYTVAKSQGSRQTDAVVAAQAAVAAVQAQTGQALGPGMIEAIRSSVRAALGVPG